SRSVAALRSPRSTPPGSGRPGPGRASGRAAVPSNRPLRVHTALRRPPGGEVFVSLGTRVRLCLKDLYAQDVVEMIERETRKYEVEAIEHPAHPDFKKAYQILWDAFGPNGEMEPEDVIRQMLLDDQTTPQPDTGTFARYFLLVARDRATGAIRGVRDGRVLLNPAYAPDLCVVYLSHIFMLPEARGTVLTYWLRIAPLDLAVTYLHTLHQLGRIELPDPHAIRRYFGMRVDLAAEG